MNIVMTSYSENQTHISFTAPEFQRDTNFRLAQYEYRGSASNGWEIVRDHALYLRLGPGYTPIQTQYCGICSTDLARASLPFPLPQVIGHEVVCMQDNAAVAVEINASHLARNDNPSACPYCSTGLDTHCPERLTLGIDRLPGGFAPWILAPIAAIHHIPAALSPQTAIFAEPFAAALRALEISQPQTGDRIAVLGPRRLGLLLLAALACHRKQHDCDFSITALHRHNWLSDICLDMGADEAICIEETPHDRLKGSYDIVFDTTGNPAGFIQALQFARRIVHVKSTHGRKVDQMTHLTEMVIDEITLHPYTSSKALHTSFQEKALPGSHIYLAPTVPDAIQAEIRALAPDCHFHQTDIETAQSLIASHLSCDGRGLRGFDVALVTNLVEADIIIRPVPGSPLPLVRARGAIFVIAGMAPCETPLSTAMSQRGLEIHTSRCGHIPQALAILADHPALMHTMETRLITHRYPVSELPRAFKTGKMSRSSIKVLIDTGHCA